MGQPIVDVVEEQCEHCFWWNGHICTQPDIEDNIPVEDCALFCEDEYS